VFAFQTVEPLGPAGTGQTGLGLLGERDVTVGVPGTQGFGFSARYQTILGVLT
jgi:hypothetical protein